MKKFFSNVWILKRYVLWCLSLDIEFSVSWMATMFFYGCALGLSGLSPNSIWFLAVLLLGATTLHFVGFALYHKRPRVGPV